MVKRTIHCEICSSDHPEPHCTNLEKAISKEVSIVYYLIHYYDHPYMNIDITPCYLIPEGYIPCNDYLEFFSNGQKVSESGYDIKAFILSLLNTHVTTCKENAFKISKKLIEEGFTKDVHKTILNRDKNLKYLEKFL